MDNLKSTIICIDKIAVSIFYRKNINRLNNISEEKLEIEIYIGAKRYQSMVIPRIKLKDF